jgi:hypothetical protein
VVAAPHLVQNVDEPIGSDHRHFAMQNGPTHLEYRDQIVCR